MSRIVVAQVESSSPPGLLIPWARARGVALDVVRVDRGQALPRPAQADGLVLLGAETAATPLPDPAVRTWAAEALAIDVPLLGLGRGSHLMATVLGAEISRAPAPEAEFLAIQPGAAGIPPGPWLSYGSDRVTFHDSPWPLVEDGRGTRVFRAGPHLGVDFHPHATPDIVGGWARTGHIPASPDLADELRSDISFIAQHARALFSDWALRAGLDVSVGDAPVHAVR